MPVHPRWTDDVEEALPLARGGKWGTSSCREGLSRLQLSVAMTPPIGGPATDSRAICLSYAAVPKPVALFGRICLTITPWRSGVSMGRIGWACDAIPISGEHRLDVATWVVIVGLGILNSCSAGSGRACLGGCCSPNGRGRRPVLGHLAPCGGFSPNRSGARRSGSRRTRPR